MTRLAFALNAVDIDVRVAEEGRPDPRGLVVAHDVAGAGLVMEDERVRVTAAIVPHGPIKPAFAFRFDTKDRSIVISGDTAYSDALIELARGADVLVHEAIYLPAIERLLGRNPNAATLRRHLLDGHTTPEDAGRVATLAGVKTLVLSHLVPGDDPEVTDEIWLAEARKTYAGPIVVGRDLMEL
jgi:ribonuclease BN (tRNA processing enzyme)